MVLPQVAILPTIASQEDETMIAAAVATEVAKFADPENKET